MERKKITKSEITLFLFAIVAMLTIGAWPVDMPANQRAIIQPVLCLAGCAAALAALFAIRLAIRKKWKPESLFLLLFIPLSLGMMLVMPIWRAPDEPAHLQRIWQISLGNWFPDESTMGVFMEPANLLEGVRDYKETKLYHVITKWDSQMDMDNLVESDLGPNTGIYPISNYFPQAIGMAIVRLFTKSRMAIFYGARIGAWLVSLALFYYAVKKMPAGKFAMIAVTLMPMMLQEAASASADGMTCAANMAFIAFIADACYHPGLFDWKKKLELFVLLALVGTLKMLYCPLVFLGFAIPTSCFGSKRSKRRMLAGMIAAVLGFAIIWILFCNTNYVGAGMSRGDAMRDQINWMLRNPLAFLMVLFRTAFLRFGTDVELLIGSELSWLNIRIPSLLFWALVLMLVRIALEDDGLARHEEETHPLKRWGIILSGLCVLVISLSLYIWQTPCANETVIGIQGRYFIPLLPALYAGMKKGQGASETDRVRTLSAMAIIDVCVLAFVLLHTAV